MATNSTENNATKNVAGEKPSKINDALRILDEALSTQGADLKAMVTDDFANLKSALGTISPRMAESFRDVGTKAYDQVSGMASEFASSGMERGRQIYGEVDASVRSNPWPVIGGVAVGTFALGFLLGRSRGGESASTTAPGTYSH